MRKKDHHIIPRFLLKGFTGDDGKLFEYDLNTLTIVKKAPGGVAHSKDFYTIELGDGPSDKVEEVLSKIESKAAKVIRKLAENKEQPDSEEWAVILHFVALQHLRVPHLRQQIAKFCEEVDEKTTRIAKAMNLNVEESTRDAKFQTEFTRSKNFTNPMMLKSSEMVFELLRRRGYVLVHTQKDEECTFIMADNPVVINDLRLDKGPPYFPLAPFGPFTSIHMTLTPRMAFCSDPNPSQVGIGFISSEGIRHHNRLQILNSSRRIYSSEGDFRFCDVHGKNLQCSDYFEDQRQVREATGWRPKWDIK